MIRILRYLAGRLWICAGVGIPLAFVLMPYVEKTASRLHPAVGVGLILGGIFFIAGFVLNLAGKKAISGQIKEAETWARAGIVHRSEGHFLRALRIYDSFLLSPWQARKSAHQLAGSVARFSLAQSGTNRVFEPLTTLFLKVSPHQRDVVLLWLKRLSKEHAVSIHEQELLECLADVWSDDPEIGPLLADLFLRTGRRDYCAKKLYSTVLKDGGTDNRTRSSILKIIGPEDKMFPMAGPGEDYYKKSDVKDPSAGTLGSGLMHPVKLVWLICCTLGKAAKFTVIGTASFLKKSVSYFRESQKIKKAVQWGVILLLCSCFILFMANTLLHLFNEKHQQRSQESIELEVPKPFTIQVAAYLKESHANSYLGQLRNNGLDAHLAKADGGGRSWYLVRIAAFRDRQAARAYGSQLKQEGKIEDFFVANNDGNRLDIPD